MKRTAKKRVAKSAKPKLTRSQVIFLLVVGVIILVGGYYFVVKPIQIRAEKNRFLSAKSELHTSVSGLGVELSKLSVNEVDYCSYSSDKFSKGRLTCTVSYKANLSDKLSSSLIKKIISENSDFSSYSLYEERENIVFEKSDQNLRCYASFLKGLILELNFACSGPAMTEHFPLKN